MSENEKETKHTYYNLELPSQGKYGISKEIEFRPFTVEDEKDLATLSNKNYEIVISKVLKRVVKGVDVGELSVGDRIHLLVNLRVNSYDKDYSFDWSCKYCAYSNTHIQDLTKLSIDSLPKNFKEPYDLKLPVSEEVIQIQLLKAKDELQVFKMLKDMDKPDEWALKYACTIVEKNTSISNKYKKLLTMHTKDFREIRRWHTKMNHGPNFQIKVRCSNCEGADKFNIPFTPEWYIPS
jgi:hypothetical protein